MSRSRKTPMLCGIEINTVEKMCAYIFLSGVGYGLLFSPTIVVVGIYFNKRRSLANGLAMAGGSMGQLCIPQIVRLLTDMFTFRGALMIYAGLILNTIVGASLFRPFSFYTKSAKKKSGSATTKPPVVPVTEIPDIIVDEKGNALNEEVKCEGCDCYRKGGILYGNHSVENISKMKEEMKPLHHVCSEPETKGSAPNLSVPNDVHIRAKSKSDSRPGSYRRMSDCDCECHGSGLDATRQLYTSTGSLYFLPMQDVPVDLRKSAQSIGNPPKDSLFMAIRASFCCWCDKKNTAKPLFDWSMLKNWMFISYVMALCCGNVGYVNTILFVPPFTEDIGLSKKSAALLLSIGGVSDLIGRVFGGWFADLGLIKRHNIMAISICLTSIAAMVCPFFPNFPSMVVLLMIMGIFGGFYIAIMAVILVDYVGLVKMPKAFGLTIMFMGLANMGTPALMGKFKCFK